MHDLIASILGFIFGRGTTLLNLWIDLFFFIYFFSASEIGAINICCSGLTHI